MRKSFALGVVGGIVSLFISTATNATDATWGTASGNWSAVSATAGWTNAVPDAIGDTGTYTAGSSVVTTQDLTGNRTVGKLEVTGAGNASWSIALATGKNLILNQDGAGAGNPAVLSNTMTNGTGGNPALIFTGGAGIITLNDDLLISNTGASIRTSGSIQIDPQIQGAGNITFYNVSNDIGHGQIALQRTGPGASNFSGNSTIAKGAVTFSRGDRFTPTPGDIVTIGSAGNGDATLGWVGGGLTIENNLVAAANTGGVSVLVNASGTAGSLVNFKSTNTYAANLTLNGNLTVRNIGASGSIMTIGDPVVGVGKLTKDGTGVVRITNTLNSYSGGTQVSAGALIVSHDDAVTTQFGHYDAIDGRLGYGNVKVDTSANLEIETSLAAIDVIANTATVSLDGILQLDDTINERVGGLILGGVTQTAPGTYGTTASGATHPDDLHFSGNGLLTLSADFNLDGVVDAGDYVTWRKSKASIASTISPANLGGEAAYTNWRVNYYGTPGAGSSLGTKGGAVPEPGSLLLVAGALLACVPRRRR
jgi:fibronectin-binding autotransporter adhesin